MTALRQLKSKKVAIPEDLYSLTQLKLGGGAAHCGIQIFDFGFEGLSRDIRKQEFAI